jgi:hypothetical protein
VPGILIILLLLLFFIFQIFFFILIFLSSVDADTQTTYATILCACASCKR